MLKKENDNLATNQLFIVVTFQSHKMMRGNEMNIFSSLHISKHTFTNKNNALIEQKNDEEKCFLLFLTTSEVFRIFAPIFVVAPYGGWSTLPIPSL